VKPPAFAGIGTNEEDLRMTTRTARIVFALLIAAGMPARAEHEGPGEHAKHATHTITLDGIDVRPSAVTMDHGDVVGFENYSTHPVQVTFTDPADLQSKIRCGLVHGTAGAPPEPWSVFTWKNGKLTGNIPPGRFASVCSLEPGTYSYTATIISSGARGGGTPGTLEPKGQIVVK
jgi:plastocyanin